MVLGVPIMITRAVTDATGLATADFTGGFNNGRCKIVVRYFGQTLVEREVIVNVSLVDPAEEISNYPNPFRAGTEMTNISFFVENPVEVKLKIYNLMGKTVLEKTYTESEIAVMIAASGNMVTFVWDGKNTKGKIVGNGGYICAVEAGQAKYKRKIAVRK
jgi:flagellar hook assembly protein FlgD